MSRVYHYTFENQSLPIMVCEDSWKKTKGTFLRSGNLTEMDSIQSFYELIPKDQNVNIVDIGAQSGLYSLLSKHLPMCTFYSFEPFKETYDILLKNIKINDIKNIKTFNIAVSKETESHKLTVCKHNNGFHTMSNQPIRFSNDNAYTVDVQTDTLDNLFFENNIPVHFIKIDTEGWEYNILLGAHKCISKWHPTIQLEWQEINMKQCNSDPKSMLALLESYGYREMYHIGEDKCFTYSTLNGEPL